MSFIGINMEMSVLLLFMKIFCMLSAGVKGEPSGYALPNVTEYFPLIKGDLTKLSWAHAVNSLFLLRNALEDKNVMMLEADIVLGTLTGQKEIIPIMAHPPKNTSDLSLQMFIVAVINAQKNTKKGIKLDFKSTECFKKSWEVIDLLSKQINFPVFLNADILPGPVNSQVKPVDTETFLKLSSTRLPSSTLSLGWTTYFAPGMEGVYTEEQLTAMGAALEKYEVKQPVTLCVRAGIIAKTHGFEDLIKRIDKFQKSMQTSATIWMSTDSDPVDVPQLRNLILRLGKSRVFLDVPKFIHDKLDLDKNAPRTPITAAQEALVALLTSVSAIFSNIFLP